VNLESDLFLGEQSEFPMQPTGAKYVRRTIYLRRRLAWQFHNLAIGGSWQLADLARVMITLGLTIRQLYEMEEEIRGTHELITGVEALTRLTRGRVSRPYHRRGANRKGVWITVHLPSGFLSHVATYARMNGQSQNNALTMFLRDGILCYLTGYNRFLKALTTRQ